MSEERRDVELLGGLVAHGLTKDQEAKLLSRKVFVEQYCKVREWTVEGMTVPQLLEIRAQEGWKNSG